MQIKDVCCNLSEKNGKFPDLKIPEFVPESNRRRDEHASRTPSATHIEGRGAWRSFRPVTSRKPQGIRSRLLLSNGYVPTSTIIVTRSLEVRGDVTTYQSPWKSLNGPRTSLLVGWYRHSKYRKDGHGTCRTLGTRGIGEGRVK